MSDDRLLDAVRAVVLSLLPNYRYLGFHRYVVSSWSEADQTFDGSPVDPDVGLPIITKVPFRSPGIATIKLETAETVLIGFESADPTKPFVAHLGFPTGTSLPVARQGDLVATGVVLLDLSTVMNIAAGIQAALPPSTPVTAGTLGAAFSAIALTLTSANAMVTTNPPPPPFVATVGGPVTLTGVITSGSLRNKSK